MDSIEKKLIISKLKNEIIEKQKNIKKKFFE